MGVVHGCRVRAGWRVCFVAVSIDSIAVALFGVLVCTVLTKRLACLEKACGCVAPSIEVSVTRHL